MKIQAIFNRDGGTFRTTDMEAYVRHAEKIFGEAGHHLDCDVVEGADIADALKRSANRDDLDAMVAGGGDGTISAAAGFAWKAGMPLGVVPAGTSDRARLPGRRRTRRLPAVPVRHSEGQTRC